MNEPPKAPPIVPQDFLGGVNVVDIGDLRVARGFSRRPSSACRHPRLLYDGQERRIWCPDCEQDIDGFDAFRLLVERWASAADSLARRQKAVEDAEAHQLVSLAAKAIDKVWRGRRMVPVCPVCSAGLFPEDFKHGPGLKLRNRHGRGKEYRGVHLVRRDRHDAGRFPLYHRRAAGSRISGDPL